MDQGCFCDKTKGKGIFGWPYACARTSPEPSQHCVVGLERHDEKERSREETKGRLRICGDHTLEGKDSCTSKCYVGVLERDFPQAGAAG